MSTEEILRIVATDSSVVINLHHTSHLGLLRALPTFQFVIPEEVIAEITEPTQAEFLSQPRQSSRANSSRTEIWREYVLKTPAELSFFADLSNRPGLGESACLASAQSRGWLVACDAKRIFLREAKERLGNARIMNTPGIYVLFIHAGLLTVEEADEAKAILEQHRFRIALASFRDLI